MDDRSAKINIGGREFELILTTRATKELSLIHISEPTRPY